MESFFFFFFSTARYAESQFPEHMLPAVKAQSLNHWTLSEVFFFFFNQEVFKEP